MTPFCSRNRNILSPELVPALPLRALPLPRHSPVQAKGYPQPCPRGCACPHRGPRCPSFPSLPAEVPLLSPPLTFAKGKARFSSQPSGRVTWRSCGGGQGCPGLTDPLKAVPARGALYEGSGLLIGAVGSQARVQARPQKQGLTRARWGVASGWPLGKGGRDQE